MILKGSPDYLDAITRQRGEQGVADNLRYITINLPTSCPRRCPQCALSTWCFKAAKTVLSLEQQKETLDKAEAAGAKILVIIGNGEPLWQPTDGQPGFDELVRPILEQTHAKGMGTIMFTTLSVEVNRKQMKVLRENNVSIFVSLHSLDAETYCKATGNGDLSTVLANIERLRAVYGENEEIDGQIVTRLGVNMTITRLNQNEISAVKAFAQAYGMQFICNPLMPQGLAERPAVWAMLVGDEANYAEQERLSKEYLIHTAKALSAQESVPTAIGVSPSTLTAR